MDIKNITRATILIILPIIALLAVIQHPENEAMAIAGCDKQGMATPACYINTPAPGQAPVAITDWSQCAANFSGGNCRSCCKSCAAKTPKGLDACLTACAN